MKFVREQHDTRLEGPGKVTSELLAVDLDQGRVLLKAHWQIGSKESPVDMENICFVSTDYFEKKYGKRAQEVLAGIRKDAQEVIARVG